MSKLIKMNQEHLEQIRQEFNDVLKNLKMSDGKVTFTKTLGTVDRKATIYFTELAYLKMMTLIREFDKEVAWHGIASRGGDPEKDEYIISDILVYPQEVTGSTVNTDQEKYQMWLMSHEDEVFNNIRMQGHSHVNMSTSPSGVDNSLYERLLEQLDDDMFYIFMIWNKRGEKTIKIYDLVKNVLFETADVTVCVMDDGTGIESFLKNAKEMVQDKKYTPPVTQNTYGGNQYGGYSRGQYGNQYGGSKPNTPAPTKPVDTKTAPADTKKKKLKRKENSTTQKYYGGGYGYSNGYWDDDYDDYYGYYGRH